MAVQRATTKYVAILHDDDRWNPDFLARTLPLLKDHVGFVFSQATVSIDGVEKLNFKGVYGTGVLNACDLIDGMSLQNDIISPSCCVFRRTDVLNSLIVGGVPMADYVRGVMAGPDALITMLLAYKYGLAAFVEEPLVTFIGGEDSVTVKSDKQALMQNYAVAFKFARAVYDCARGA